MPATLTLLSGIWKSRALLRPLVAQEFRQRYAGSFGGIAWAVITPALTILVLWLVMGYGLKIAIPGAPFFLVLLCKFLPWMFFAESAGAGVGAITSRSFLITKVAFPLELLPLVPLGASLLVHLLLVGLFIVAITLQGRAPGPEIVTLPYFLAALVLAVAGLNVLTSVVSVFYKDFAIAVPSILNIWFWLTPIVWPLEQMPEAVRDWMFLNPMAMIVEGYRHALLGGPLPESFGTMTAAFWIWTGLLLVLGPVVFRRLRPHIADTL
jgi:lipopolysaccharide transport system permease protein/teichoic acid transport system permease protein